MTDRNFHFENALLALQSGQPLSGQDGVLTPLIKQLTETALAAELDTHLADKGGLHNRKNGPSRKTIKSASGNFELSTSRDRSGSFEPQLIKKHQTHMSDEIERKILSMYALGFAHKGLVPMRLSMLLASWTAKKRI
jgi:transposase-like protein